MKAWGSSSELNALEVVDDEEAAGNEEGNADKGSGQGEELTHQH